MVSKQVQVGPLALSLSASGGSATVAISLAQAVGGGELAGVAQASVNASIVVQDQMLIDAGFALAIAKFPAIASVLQLAQAACDAELQKI